MVLGCEVGGRWSIEASSFLSALAEATRCEPEVEVVRKSAMVVWLRRWSVLMACTAARAFAHCWTADVVFQFMVTLLRQKEGPSREKGSNN